MNAGATWLRAADIELDVRLSDKPAAHFRGDGRHHLNRAPEASPAVASASAWPGSPPCVERDQSAPHWTFPRGPAGHSMHRRSRFDIDAALTYGAANLPTSLYPHPYDSNGLASLEGVSSNGCCISRARCHVLAAPGRHGRRLRQVGRSRSMSSMYILGSVVSVGLLVYLAVALLLPEKFS